MADDSVPVAVPQHIWLVGGAAMLWGLYGLVNYVMVQVKIAQYMAGKSADDLANFIGPSILSHAMWLIMIFAMLSGAVLLLMHRRHAVLAFWVTFLAMLGMRAENLVLFGLDFFYAYSVNALIFIGLSFAIIIGLIVYSSRMKARGVLH